MARTGQIGKALPKAGPAGALLLGLVLAGCMAGQARPPAQADLALERVALAGDAPPDGPEGACWEKDTTPAIIETVTEQIMVAPEQRDAAGNVTAPASFRSETAQRMVQDRQEVWFRSPCPEQIDVAFVASLQRALKARGHYDAPITGILDAVTAESVRRFQAERGLDTPRLSLAAAKELGLIAVDIDRL